MAINKTQLSKKTAHLVPMLLRGNTVGTRKLWFVHSYISVLHLSSKADLNHSLLINSSQLYQGTIVIFSSVDIVVPNIRGEIS